MTKRDELERATRELRQHIEDWARAHGLTPHEQVHAITRACSRHIEFITEPLIREEKDDPKVDA